MIPIIDKHPDEIWSSYLLRVLKNGGVYIPDWDSEELVIPINKGCELEIYRYIKC